MTRFALLLAVASACGSSEPDPDIAADASDSADASQGCVDLGSATIGRCATDTLDPCTGSGVSGNRFEPIASGGVSPMVVGFQGATMMPMAVRVGSIEPDGGSDPSAHPVVSASIRDSGGLTVSTYQNSVPFAPVDGESDLYEMLDIFLIFNGDATPLVDQMVTVAVQVTDRNGELRCGELDVVAGPF